MSAARAAVSRIALLGALAALVTGCSSGPAAKAVETPNAVTSSQAIDSDLESEPETVDTDGDGAIDGDDFRPEDPQIRTPADVDTDGDGIGNGYDLRPRDPNVQSQVDVDRDKDRVPDYRDAFPRNTRYSKDSDGDGVADSVECGSG